MGTRRGKSTCCGQRVQRFGDRRRRCSQCGRTWRIRKKKRGRKPGRIAHELVQRTISERRPLVRQALRRGLSAPTLRQRFRRALQWFLERAPEPPPPAGELVLIADALWFRFGKERWTLYLLAVKPLEAAWARFLDPVLLPGKECLSQWRVATQTIPPQLSPRIRAFVSDGFRGSKALARAGGWIHQRCHFHLIAQLQGRLGRHKHLPGRGVREAIYGRIREALETASPARLALLRQELRQLSRRPSCPKRFRMFTRDFLRELDAFRAYRRYPQLHLPTTTNVIESMGKVLRDQLRPLSTPAALLRWATAIIRLRPPMVCNGSKYQPN